MKLRGFFASASAVGLITTSAFSANDSVARAAMASARRHQDAVPGYVEHVIGYFPIMPGATQVVTDMVSDRLKTAALDEVRHRMATATAKVPIAGDAVDRAMTRVEDRMSVEGVQNGLLENAVPDREIGTIQHAGKVVRQVYANGYYETIQTENRKAVRFNLSTQIAVLRVQEAVTLTEAGVAEVKRVRDSIKEISSRLVRQGAGAVGYLRDALAIFDRVSELLTFAHTAKVLNQAAGMLEKMSGTWQCEPTPLTETYPSKVTAAEQFPDETIDGTPVHVYREFYILPGMQALNPSPADDNDPPAVTPQLQRRTWVRISDNLPVRVELLLPGGRKQTMNYDYPAKVEIVLPPCLTAP